MIDVAVRLVEVAVAVVVVTVPDVVLRQVLVDLGGGLAGRELLGVPGDGLSQPILQLGLPFPTEVFLGVGGLRLGVNLDLAGPHRSKLHFRLAPGDLDDRLGDALDAGVDAGADLQDPADRGVVRRLHAGVHHVVDEDEIG